jgi:hypothetical protein
MGLSPSVFAEENSPPNQPEAWMDASHYAVEHPAVAVAIYGRTKDATQEQIADGTSSEYFGHRL